MSTSSIAGGAPALDTARMARAWDWVARLREESVSREELAEWMSWYEADDRNKEAFDEARSLWQQAGRVVDGQDRLSRALWLPDAPTGSARARGWRSHWHGFASRRGRRTAMALASAAVIVCAVVVAVLMRGDPVDTPQVRVAAMTAPTAAGAPIRASSGKRPLVRETNLPDGSRVELAVNSSVTMQFTERERLLTMQGGVAYFTVAHNRARPFVVKVNGLNVRAVGTAFNIRRARDRTVVTVTEGTVDVYPETASTSIRATAGTEITWPVKAARPTIASVDPTRALAWREGRLDYLNEPLASAIADINRYSTRQIIIRDEAVGRIVFSGTVLVEKTDDWLQALPGLFPIDVRTDPQGNIVLTSRPS